MGTGTKVGAWFRRPDGGRGKPWAGVVLDRADPRAWAGTLAFRTAPTPEQARAHLAAVGGIPTHVPVLWAFGSEPRVWWESLDSLVPYETELARWEGEAAEWELIPRN
jgi:hypothetical protein